MKPFSWARALLGSMLLLAACSAPQAATSPGANPGATAANPAGSTSGGTAGQAGGDYRFGVMIPLTGPGAVIGEAYKRGLDMAVSEINASGGVGGMKLVPDVQDHKGTAQGGTEAMNQLANIDKVPYVVSSFSSSTLAAQPTAAQNKILLMNAGGPDTSMLNKAYLFNNQVMAPSLMPPLAQYVWGQGKRKAALLTSTDPFGDGNRTAFKAGWAKLGGQVVADELFQIGATDFTAQLAKIRSSNPDVILAVAVGQTLGQIVQQARASGITATIVGPLATDDVIRLGGKGAEGFLDDGIAVDPSTTDAGAKHFLDAYKQKYGSYPDWISGTMYESVYLLRDLVQAVQKQGGDPKSGEQLQKALMANPQFHNYLSGGTVKIQADHGIQRDIAIREVKDGKWTVVKTVPPDEQVIK